MGARPSWSSSTYTAVLAIGRPMDTASGSAGTSQAVDQIVVSVGPYTFSRRFTRPRSSRARGRGSPSPPASATTSGPSKPAARSIRHPEGVAWTWDTRSDLMSSTAPGPRAASSPATTTRPPVTRGSSSSSAEMSNEREVRASHASPGAAPSRSRMPSSRFASAECGTATPLGRPVDPEV